VIVLDSAGFGPVTITKPVSITAPPGVYAGISVFSGDGIDINAGPSDEIILRGLTINNQGSSGSGIVFTAGGALHVESCVVNGFSSLSPSSGVLFRAGSARLEVKDSIMRGNSNGIAIQPGLVQAFAAIDRTLFERNFIGLLAQGNSLVTVRNSVASANHAQGFLAISTSPPPSPELNIESCVASNNEGAGIEALAVGPGTATVRVSNSTVTGNSVGLQASGGTLLSRGNNTVEGNLTGNVSGTIASYTAK
jgi:hypothetical protein